MDVATVLDPPVLICQILIEDRHKFCPRQQDSYCKHWQAKQDYKSYVSFSVVTYKVIYPIFQNLCDDELLSHCLNGTTKNLKEAFNQIVRKKCPKDTFISRVVLKTGVAFAVIIFSDGKSGFEKLFSRLNLSFGVNTKSGVVDKDQQSIKNMNNKFQETVKLKKKKAKSYRKGLYRQKNTMKGEKGI